MVSPEVARSVDEGIARAEQAIKELPKDVRRRIVTLKAMPNEVISRINQINGIIVEFEERV